MGVMQTEFSLLFAFSACVVVFAMMDFAFAVAAMAIFGAIVLSRLVERMLNELVLELFGESPALRAR